MALNMKLVEEQYFFKHSQPTQTLQTVHLIIIWQVILYRHKKTLNICNHL